MLAFEALLLSASSSLSAIYLGLFQGLCMSCYKELDVGVLRTISPRHPAKKRIEVRPFEEAP